MQGAPVTTLDFDFMFRDTPTNLRKLRAVAKSLAVVEEFARIEGLDAHGRSTSIRVGR